jgi:transposase
MGQGRRHFTDEFKQEAIALLVGSGRPLSQIASELGISPSMLRDWHNGSGGRDAGSARRPIPASAPHSAPGRLLDCPVDHRRLELTAMG